MNACIHHLPGNQKGFHLSPWHVPCVIARRWKPVTKQQVDVRLTRTFRVGRVSVQPAVSAFNVLNAGSVIVLNTRYGATWQNALGVFGPRLVKFNVQVNF